MIRTALSGQKAYSSIGYKVTSSGSVAEESRGLYAEPNNGISEEEYRFAMESIRISREQYARGEYYTYEEAIERINDFMSKL